MIAAGYHDVVYIKPSTQILIAVSNGGEIAAPFFNLKMAWHLIYGADEWKDSDGKILDGTPHLRFREGWELAIRNFNEAQLVGILSNRLSPSQEIKSPEKLIGREAYLQRIHRALHSPGRHLFIFGDRGVGKTSLAVTAGQISVNEDKNFIYIPCSNGTTFFDAIWAVGRAVSDISPVKKSGGFAVGINLPQVGGVNFGVNHGGKTLDKPTSFNDCLSMIGFVRSRLTGQIIICFDEMDRILSSGEKNNFAELLKNISSVVDDVRFIYCGIGADVDELIGAHLSVGRMFEPIHVEKLSYDSLWKIIDNAASDLSVTIPQGILIRIGVISDGFPHYVHLMGECLFYKMFDDPAYVSTCSAEHFKAALRDSLVKAEPSLRRIYQKATEKSKNSLDYEIALWALADRTATRRQIKEIYETSYSRIQNAMYTSNFLSKDVFNQRMLMLRKDSHAKIVTGHGAGWFSFRENVVRGYVRMKAESEGIELSPELTN
ncbi:AAA family ATPase [Tistrella mobilis]|uniref:AAA family ATPase n=1 Tax=Tistrella mobilis TaxID=171437 RepID=UPI0031F63D0B